MTTGHSLMSPLTNICCASNVTFLKCINVRKVIKDISSHYILKSILLNDINKYHDLKIFNYYLYTV